MDRKNFIRTLALGGLAMNLKSLNSLSSTLPIDGNRMPVLFLGHGNPMYAITDNEFTRGFKNVAASIPRPKAIVCVSAHWETNGTFVTAMAKPQTIHDFGGFPKELFEVQYPAPGDIETAKIVASSVKKTSVREDHQWGLDHGCWSVLIHMYPKADIPVLQISLDYTKPAAWHYELAKELADLRNKGVLIVGSGNMVHNLGLASWTNPKGFDWADEANDKFKSLIKSGDHKSLIEYDKLGRAIQLSVPSPDHYLPLLYVLGLKDEKDDVSFFNDRTELGSLSMTSVIVK